MPRPTSRLLVRSVIAACVVFGLAAQAGELRVMSFNIRYGTAPDGDHAWDERRPYAVQTVLAFAPDLLGTQECLAFQRDQLLAFLPGLAVVATGRDDGADGGEMCAAFFREERFAFVASGTFWLGETPEVVGSRGWDAALPRIATWLRLRELASGREILWLNTHLDHEGELARRESAAQLHAWLAANRGAATLVVTGDFNAAASAEPRSVQDLLVAGRPDAEPFARLATAPLLLDTWTAAHGDREPDAGTFHGFGRVLEPGRIDWILVSPGLRVLEAEIVRTTYGDIWPSDHCPVVAVLDW
ncbi:MAG TPA: endonuclease/exonuclease/phosphatase family protein [Candidatus Krumholzibacteria bacterium]|nr:endonuclease/exonuclease/phosphatase family protein [Candidatus Krumholzibacteria bacterium]HPD73235.1 endonuclease/exonuclease/phosphatase family protein [Candidatus Krumholzibacteria bacterium]HRY40197.1 endonuclease/exonuclease/phosphatase family protein [Candidatus Krumholzibacteria bacterium]